MKYDGQGCVRAHILNMIDIGTKLQELEMTVDEDMMVHFALNSLPKDFKSLRETYIAQKECWTLNDLITICVQQEHNIIRERGAKMVNMVQTKEKKENRHNAMTGKGSSTEKYLKPSTGMKAHEERMQKIQKWLDKQKTKGIHKEEIAKQG
ncbi:hypothetical protein Prudu_018945 [Prunus dulcis]|uniref:Uncharacterized protein n=1 Tax=Prunus dulcis TaxID=3755 RepID=A0A4Y1RS12_PRUDU|nr:hypothetical protein Prudu_018945 [Prunus dulcis]